MNTFERSPVRPIVSRPYAVDSPWFTGGAHVATFAIEELVATKIRALYQRKKGRDRHSEKRDRPHRELNGPEPPQSAGCSSADHGIVLVGRGGFEPP